MESLTTYSPANRALKGVAAMPECRSCGGPTPQGRYTCLPCRAVPRVCRQCGAASSGTRNLCASCSSIPSNEKKRDLRFNLQPGQFDELSKAQDGLCAICHQPEHAVSKTGRRYGLVVDHDRKCCPGDTSCGRCVRGLICRNCNIMLGMARDSGDLLMSAVAYLLSQGQPGDSLGVAQTDTHRLSVLSINKSVSEGDA